jgi:hypothetical protein
MLWLSSWDQVPKLKAANPGINHKVCLMSQLELQALNQFCRYVNSNSDHLFSCSPRPISQLEWQDICTF